MLTFSKQEYLYEQICGISISNLYSSFKSKAVCHRFIRTGTLPCSCFIMLPGKFSGSILSLLLAQTEQFANPQHRGGGG